jgi:nitrite reductase (cytochrome c-552)
MSERETGSSPNRPSRIALLAGVAIAAAVMTIAGLEFVVNIAERKEEARHPSVRVVALTDRTEEPEVWGKNFPREYEGYARTTEQASTRFGGSQAVPHTPGAFDPRTVTSRSKLEQDPRLKVIWAGYAFARDFRERRGHAYMLEDQAYTERQLAVKQPGTCLNCHASVYIAQKTLGNGDLRKGFETMNPMPYAEARKLVSHPLACIDCHAADTMQLRITRTAFIDGIRALKASQGVADYDVNTMATRQEMRTFVCAQCHVEYYFRGAEKRLVFPWAKGLEVGAITTYYDEQQFKDWVHADTGAPSLKAQHPEFEMWSQGPHARAGVACADCHMPYRREGATKVSDHQVRSPLLAIDRACQTCHHRPEAELRARVETIQGRHFALQNVAMDALVALIGDLKSARAAGAADPSLAAARDFQRRAQFYLDFVSAENSMGFHAPQEAARILGESIDFSRRGQLALRDAHAALKP